MKKISFYVLLLPIMLFGMNSFFNGFNSSIPLLTINNPVGIYSFVQNPALLDNQSQDFSFSYNTLYQDINATGITAKIYNHKLFSLASGFQYIRYGSFSDNLQIYNMSAKQFIIGANLFLIPNLNFGINLKYENELFLDSYNNTFSFDVGLFKSIKLKTSQIIRFGLAVVSPVLVSSDISISPNIKLAFGMKGKIANLSYSFDNEIVSFDNFQQNSDVVNLSILLYNSIDLMLSNKFDSFMLLNPALGLRYKVLSLKNIFVISYALQNLTSNMIQHSLNLYIKIH